MTGDKTRLRLLYLVKFFEEKTDEQHPASMADMIDYLAENEINAIRQTIYKDLDFLREFGMDIVMVKKTNTGYFLGERKFQLAELKLLVDSIQSSKFISQKKTMELIKKLESLTSKTEAATLQRQVYVHDRVKTMNESVYYNVDSISDAISEDHPICFKYYEYTVSKEKHFKKEGAYYTVSPFALICDNENYYLLAYENSSNQMKHFRVDKITSIGVLEKERRTGKKIFSQIDMSAYTKKTFSMFGGEEKMVQMRWKNHLVNVVLDRFGSDAFIAPEETGWFGLSTRVVVSPQFYAWLSGFGEEVEIIAPEDVRNGMKVHLQNALKNYKSK